jgi:hypothetical protein
MLSNSSEEIVLCTPSLTPRSFDRDAILSVKRWTLLVRLDDVDEDAVSKSMGVTVTGGEISCDAASCSLAEYAWSSSNADGALISVPS